jgi:hypothetical protein
VATKTYHLRLNADGTITVRVGCSVEYITMRDRSRTDVFDAVKYALISKDAYISEERLIKDLWEELYGHA